MQTKRYRDEHDKATSLTVVTEKNVPGASLSVEILRISPLTTGNSDSDFAFVAVGILVSRRRRGMKKTLPY